MSIRHHMHSAEAALELVPRLFDMRLQTPRCLVSHEAQPNPKEQNEAILESLPALRDYMTWARPEQTVAYAQDALEKLFARHARGEEALYQIRLRDDGRFVGAIGFHHINAPVPAAEVGYWLRTGLAGQGLMTEVLAAAAEHALDVAGVVRLQLVAAAENAASRRVAEKCGFTLEGTRRWARVRLDGSLGDECVYVRFASQR